jgi:hypothetical protein
LRHGEQEWLLPSARAQARIPAAVRFQEQWPLALRLLRQTCAARIAVTGGAADAEFGDVTAFAPHCIASTGRTSSGSRRI